MKSAEIHKKYIDYINNTRETQSGSISLVLLLISAFDEDWEPVGPMVRKNMVRDGLIQERDGGIYLHADLVRAKG